jgi:4a-hydroxytetrahydrobiopterin dehydratase
MTQPQTPNGWAYSPDGKALHRKFSFARYLDGLEACRKVAELAESMNHHPDLLLGYKTLEVTWSTHSQGGVTELDLQAAERTNGLLA